MRSPAFLPPAARARVLVARGLEDGVWDGPVARMMSRAWGAIAARRLARPLVWRDGIAVIAVGGATLGGSGKTPLAIACARALAATGARVALVGHGYGARPRSARVVSPDDGVDDVGDEAIVAARALRGVASVIVAPKRQAAVSLAETLADVLVLDGVLQTAPRRAALSLLALDGASPWGSGEVVPRGDLRASRPRLVDICDYVVVLEDGSCSADCPSDSYLSARVHSRGAFVEDELVRWPQLASLRIGLFLALARPARVLGALARRDVYPQRVVQLPDHCFSAAVPLHAHLCDPEVDLWLATPKCAVHLARAKVPHAVLEHYVELGAPLLARVCAPTSARDFGALTLPACGRYSGFGVETANFG